MSETPHSPKTVVRGETSSVPAPSGIEDPLEIVVEKHGVETWLVLTGELDLGTVTEPDEALQAASGRDRVVLDIREVSFCDSSGLAVLLRAKRRMNGLKILMGDGVGRRDARRRQRSAPAGRRDEAVSSRITGGPEGPRPAPGPDLTDSMPDNVGYVKR